MSSMVAETIPVRIEEPCAGSEKIVKSSGDSKTESVIATKTPVIPMIMVRASTIFVARIPLGNPRIRRRRTAMRRMVKAD